MAGRNLHVQLGLWIAVVLAFVFIGVSMFSRKVSVLSIAAWSFILVFPLLQVQIQKVVGVDDPHRCSCLRWSVENDDEDNDAEEEVSYELRGNVVNVKQRERLEYNHTDLSEDEWYNQHMDIKWYRSGDFSFWFAVAKAMLNIYSIATTPIGLGSLIPDRDSPGWVGLIWVVSIEAPYMFLILLPYFSCTAVKLCYRFSLRQWISGQLDPEGRSREGAGKLVVQLSGLLKSLGRFSALNLLEFIRIDDFMDQDKMQKVMSIIGAVIGFMAFRCKIVDIAFVVNTHERNWTFRQWITVLALINNMVSIADKKEKMIFVAIKTKYYRKDRWLEAVGDHLLKMKHMDDHGNVTPAWSHEILYCVLKRLVSMGPDDVNRLIEDLTIKKTSNRCRRREIPKRISDDCWNWQLTNIVGVVRFGLFWLLADEAESASQREQVLVKGKVRRAFDAQNKALESEPLYVAKIQELEARLAKLSSASSQPDAHLQTLRSP